MAMLSAMINACGCYHPELLDTDLDQDRFLTAVAILMSKVRTIAAFSYKMTLGQRVEYPDPALSYCRNFLHMMFSKFGCGVELLRSSRRGTVDYAAIPELRGVNLEPYRKPPVTVVRINFLEPGLP